MLRAVAKELHELQSEPPEGIKVLLNEADLTDIQASIEGPGKSGLLTYFWKRQKFECPEKIIEVCIGS